MEQPYATTLRASGQLPFEVRGPRGPSHSLLRLAGIVGLIGAILVAAADIVLLSVPGGNYGSGSFAYLAAVPSGRLILGHFMGVLALPLEIIGFWQLAQGLAPGGKRASLIFLLVSAYSVVLGAVYHAALAPIAAVVQAQQAASEANTALTALIDTLSGYARPFSSITGAGVLVISIIFAWRVGFGRSHYPRWMALVNPLTLTIAVIALGRALPALGDVLLPAAFSIANAVLFALSTAWVWTLRARG